MNQDQITEIQKLLAEVVSSNREIKEELKQFRREITAEITSLKQKNTKLEQDIIELRDELQITQKKLKKYNVVFYGISEEKDIQTECLNILNNVLKVKCTSQAFRDVYRIGKKADGKNRPVVIEFINFDVKKTIFQNIKFTGKTLKSLGFSLAQDYTKNDLKKQKVLTENLKIAKQKNYNAKIVRDTLIINGEIYNFERLNEISDLLPLEHYTEGNNIPRKERIVSTESDKPASTPQTPTIDSFPNNSKVLTSATTGTENIKNKIEEFPPMFSGSIPYKIVTRQKKSSSSNYRNQS